MKNIKFLILSTVLILLSACSNVDFGNINQNTNGASKINASSALAGAMMNFATITGRNYLTKPTLYVQYQSQVTYTDEMRYSEAPASWYAYYVQTLSNLQQVIDINSDPAKQTVILQSQGFAANQIGVAMIMKAVIAKRLTDTYGDVPFSEALDPSNVTPAYDSQESIYNAIIANVKAARDMLDASKLGPTGDIIYGGDVTKWKKFANSFLLQVTLQLSKKFPSPTGMAATEFKSALSDPAGVIETVGDEAWFSYQDLIGFRNPWNRNRTTDYYLSQEFTDALKGNTGLNPTSNRTPDSRMSVYATNNNDGVPYGHKNGSGAGKSQMSTDNYWNDTSPLPFMTASYTFLNRADAAAMGWTTEDAATMLRSGIEMSFTTLESHTGITIAADGPAYATARLADATTVGMNKVISEEKWISLFPSGFDAWDEWRRTEIPTLVPAVDFLNSGVIPRRYTYPLEESSLNATNYESGVNALSPATDNNSSKVWWDQ